MLAVCKAAAKLWMTFVVGSRSWGVGKTCFQPLLLLPGSGQSREVIHSQLQAEHLPLSSSMTSIWDARASGQPVGFIWSPETRCYALLLSSTYTQTHEHATISMFNPKGRPCSQHPSLLSSALPSGTQE